MKEIAQHSEIYVKIVCFRWSDEIGHVVSTENHRCGAAAAEWHLRLNVLATVASVCAKKTRFRHSFDFAWVSDGFGTENRELMRNAVVVVHAAGYFWETRIEWLKIR